MRGKVFAEGDGEEVLGARRPGQTRPPAPGSPAGIETKLPEGSRGEHGMHVLPLPIIPNCLCGLLALYFASFRGLYVPVRLPVAVRGALCCSPRSVPELPLLLGRCRGGTPASPSSRCSPWLPGRVPVLLF